MRDIGLSLAGNWRIALAILVLVCAPLYVTAATTPTTETTATTAESPDRERPGLPFLISTLAREHQELQGKLKEYVRWGSDITHVELLVSYQNFERSIKQLPLQLQDSRLQLSKYLLLLSRIGLDTPVTMADDIEHVSQTELKRYGTAAATEIFKRTDAQLEMLIASTRSTLTYIYPRIQKLQQGDALAHYGIRRQLDRLGQSIFRLQETAFAREDHFKFSNDLLEQQLNAHIRTIYIAAAAGGLIMLLMAGVYLLQKIRTAKRLAATNKQLQVEMDASRKLSEQLSYNSTHDQLTNLYNRFGLLESLGKLYEDTSHGHGIIFIDLDGFKTVNDTCGHAAGDELLQNIAILLKRKSFASSVVARFGGDEFVVLVPRCNPGELRGLSVALCNLLSEMDFNWEGHKFPVGGSFGVVHFNPEMTDRISLMREVDEASYAAKQAGGSQVKFRALSSPPFNAVSSNPSKRNAA